MFVKKIFPKYAPIFNWVNLHKRVLGDNNVRIIYGLHKFHGYIIRYLYLPTGFN